MRVSGLAEASGVSVATVKYYLREGLLHPGRATSRTQATYDESHVERIRLVRALTEVGGLSLASIGRVLEAIAGDDVERIGVLASAQRALTDSDPVTAPRPVHEDPWPRSRVHDWLARRGWRVDPADPVIAELESAWAACDQAGLGLDEERLDAYADAVEEIARIDVDSVPTEPQAALRQVVLGTVLIDPALAALRRLAQQHIAVSRHLDGTV